MRLDYAGSLADDLAAFAAVLDRAVAEPSLLSRPVAGCPGWSLHDLTDHLGAVHRWVVTAIEEGHGRGAAAPAPREPEALRAWFVDGGEALTAHLAGDPTQPVWSFSRVPGHDTLGFWQRRQAQENLVHRWDAQAAIGEPELVDARLAADGIGEITEVFIPRMRARGLLGELPDAVRIVARDVGGEWLIGDGPVGGGQVVATLAGPASGLLLHLWKRAGEAGLSWDGDAERGRATLANSVTA